MSATSVATPSAVVIATDLSAHAEPALRRGSAHAAALGVPYVVVHVIPDVLRHHPLLPTPSENDAELALSLTRRVTELVDEQIGRVLGASRGEVRIRVEIGDAEDEIVRVAEEERASLICVGARPRHGAERALGHVAERVVRYAHTTVLVARHGPQTRRVLVATDFTEGSMPALRAAGTLVEHMSVDVTLLHVMELPRVTALTSAFSALGSPWTPPSTAAIEQLEGLGRTMLDNLAKQYRLQHVEQVEGDPAEVILARAQALDAEMIVLGSHGRTGLRRLVLGSTAEHVIRIATRSVLVARG